MSGAAIACMVIVLGVVVGGFFALLALAIRFESQRDRQPGDRGGG